MALRLPIDGGVASYYFRLRFSETSWQRANLYGDGVRSRTMIPGLIFVLLFLTLLQFFVSYSHSLMVQSRSYELSEQAREICGFTAKTVAGDQFLRLQQLIALCPDPGGDAFEIRATALYFHLLGLACMLLNRTIPSVDHWIEKERGGCAYVAAVALDRRIVYSRMMMTQQESQQI